MTRLCSHCTSSGHNSRTCPSRGGAGGGLRLFGVQLTEGSGAMKKSASMSCIASESVGGGAMSSGDRASVAGSGYASDDPGRTTCSTNRRSERKKGIAWTEEEHRMFLLGLKKLGKGDWRGIARNYVVSRTPTQVASHAQKYFIRQTNSTRRKRRTSLFDMPMNELQIREEDLLPLSPPNESANKNQLPPLHLGQLEVPEIMAPSSSKHTPARETISYNNNTPIAMVPTFFPAYIPMPVSFWPAAVINTAKEVTTGESHNILRPTLIVRRETPKMDEVVSLSNLSIGPVKAVEPSALSLKLGPSSSKPSAFHLAPTADINQSNVSPIHAL